MDKMHNGCILWGGVGTGKSITSLAYFVSKVCKGTYGDYGSMRTPKDVYIITTAKKRDSLDWEKEAIAFGISPTPEYSISNIKLTVDSWNNIEDYVDVKDAFFIFDEQRVVGSGSWSKTFIKIAKRNEWVLLSATPGDTWLDYIPVFVANGWYKNRTEFKREHVVYNTYSKFPKVDRYVGVGQLVRYRNQILVHMPYDRHTKRHDKTVIVDYDKQLFDRVVNDRWHVYENRPLRDVAELFGVMRKVVNSDASRLLAIGELMKKHPRLIVFYNFDYELEMLRSLGSATTSIPATEKNAGEHPIGVDQDSSTESPRELGTTHIPPSQAESQSMSRFELERAAKCVALQKSEKTGSTSLQKKWLESHPAWEEMPEGLQLVDTKNSSMLSSSPGRSSGCSTSTVVGSSRSNKHTSGLPSSAPAQGDEEWKTSSTKTRKSSSEKQLDLSKSFSKTGIDLASPSSGLGQIQSLSRLDQGADVPDVTPTDARFEIAEWNGHKHEPVPSSKNWVYLVQYTAGSEGWNCIDTDAMVFYSLTYSYKAYHQSKGRIDRLNTTFVDLWYYTLASKSMIDGAILKSLKNKKSFNEANLALNY